jgi:hypothetical protein
MDDSYESILETLIDLEKNSPLYSNLVQTDLYTAMM